MRRETPLIGVRMVATHELAETGDGRVTLVVGIELRGPLVRLLGGRIAATAERLAMECSDHRTG
jgi:hypothetical protein